MVSSLSTIPIPLTVPNANDMLTLASIDRITPETFFSNSASPIALASLLTAAFLLRERFKHMSSFPYKLPNFASQAHPLEKDALETRGNVYTFPGRTGIVEAVPVRLQDRTTSEWDAFAQACNASFRSAHNWLKGWSIKTWPRQQLRLFEFYVSGRKVGQCAIGLGRTERTFLDALVIQPGFESLWANCMEAVLIRLGPGKYHYGWHLNLERSREEELRSISGLAIEEAHPITVHAVDFSRWHNWEEYWMSTSNNTRRNAKRGEQSSLKIITRTGFGCLLQAGAIARLRSVMYERKGLKFHQLSALASYVGGHLVAPQHRLTVIAADERKPQAGFVGYEFGSHTYYVAGGSRSFNNGVAWYLQKLMLQRAWNRTQGRAKFVMGHVDYSTHDEAIGGGLLRSRRSVNVSDYETSIVTFRYEGESATSGKMPLSS